MDILSEQPHVTLTGSSTLHGAVPPRYDAQLVCCYAACFATGARSLYAALGIRVAPHHRTVPSAAQHTRAQRVSAWLHITHLRHRAFSVRGVCEVSPHERSRISRSNDLL
jgi:hypothetical protein